MKPIGHVVTTFAALVALGTIQLAVTQGPQASAEEQLQSRPAPNPEPRPIEPRPEPQPRPRPTHTGDPPDAPPPK